MANIADIIEEYIKAMLNQSNGGIIMVRRNQLAEKFQCVPSQINYVLSTRFSFNRGYIIETRRGGGGFVRIMKVPMEESRDIMDIIYEKIGDRISLHEASDMIRYLYDEELITKREAHLMQNVLEVCDSPGLDGSQLSVIFKAMLMALLRHSK